MLYLPFVQAAHGLTRNRFNKLKAAGAFNCELPEGRPGVATLIPIESAHDIGFVALLHSAGFSPTDAKMKSFEWLRHWQRGSLDKCQTFNPAAGTVSRRSEKKTVAQLCMDRSEQAEMPMGHELRHAELIVTINIAEIVARNEAVAEYTAARLREMEEAAD